MSDETRKRLPKWLKIKLQTGDDFRHVKNLLREKSLHTVCEESKCPNKMECWGRHTATFIILGDICTRNCHFCAVTTGKPKPPNPAEPANVAEAVLKMNLQHVVLTSVDRDDLPDFGADHWVQTIETIRHINPDTSIEVLTPDFMGHRDVLSAVFTAKPDIFSHNVETVQRLSKSIRPSANWERSLNVLRQSVAAGLNSKSGMMLGLGETWEEILQTMQVVRDTGVQIFNIGQYLQPSFEQSDVKKYYHPDAFAELKKAGLDMGFKVVESAPLVRSSYHADVQVAALTE